MMKIISFSVDAAMSAERGEDWTRISTSEYGVKFSCRAGNVDIRLTGDLAGEMRRLIDAIDPHTPEKAVGAALALLGALGKEIDAPSDVDQTGSV